MTDCDVLKINNFRCNLFLLFFLVLRVAKNILHLLIFNCFAFMEGIIFKYVCSRPWSVTQKVIETFIVWQIRLHFDKEFCIKNFRFQQWPFKTDGQRTRIKINISVQNKNSITYFLECNFDTQSFSNNLERQSRTSELGKIVYRN